jgi:hypothetical protein
MLFKKIRLVAAWAGVFVSPLAFGQTPPVTGQQASQIITTSVPFLLVSPEARGAAMGDVGVATSPDASSAHWNPAKYAFIEKDFGASVSYSPWLRNIIPDMSLSYLTGYYRLRKQDVVAASIRYFSLGQLQLTDAQGRQQGLSDPREFAFDLTYSRQLSKRFSMGVTARLFQSNLATTIGSGNQATATSAAVDISMFYSKPNIMVGGLNTTWAWGMNLSNIGPKLTYVNRNSQDYIPTNLRLGTSWTADFDEYNRLTVALDANKLLVPTPKRDGVTPQQDTDKSLIGAIGSSLTEAPDGFGEKLREMQISFGVEYWYSKLLAIRAGYFYEDALKGNRKYFTIGGGLRYQTFGLDFVYMLPQAQNHPLADTFRFTLLFDFNKSKKSKTEDAPVESSPSTN